MLRRDLETFFFGTAILKTRERDPDRRPQVIKQKPPARQPRSAGALLFDQVWQRGEGVGGGSGSGLVFAARRDVGDRGGGGARKRIERQGELLGGRLADVDLVAVEQLDIVLADVDGLALPRRAPA